MKKTLVIALTLMFLLSMTACAAPAAAQAQLPVQSAPASVPVQSAPEQPAQPAQSAPAPAKPPATPDIGLDKAKAIAFAHAGLTEGEVAFAKGELDRDDGRLVYEIDFYSAGREYEYDIDAATGEILEWDVERYPD